jgi:hypothetical protein
MPFDYSMGVSFYEEIHPCLMRHGNNNAHSMGMEVIAECGMKHFLDKFRRKGTVGSAGHAALPPAHMQTAGASDRAEGCGRELVLLLAGMIRSAGTCYGDG